MNRLNHSEPARLRVAVMRIDVVNGVISTTFAGRYASQRAFWLRTMQFPRGSYTVTGWQNFTRVYIVQGDEHNGFGFAFRSS